MSRGWMLTARWKCFVYALAPKLCQGINCFGELLLAEAKNKPRARLEIQQYWLLSGSAWDCFLALPHCFCRCDLHTEKCTAGVAARMMGEVLSMSSGSPLSAWGVPAAQHCGFSPPRAPQKPRDDRLHLHVGWQGKGKGSVLRWWEKLVWVTGTWNGVQLGGSPAQC